MTHTTTEPANLATVGKFFEAGPSKGDIASADALLAAGFSLHVPLPVAGPGISAINNVITSCRAAFHGLNVTTGDMTAEGDMVTCRSAARGEHKGEFMGLFAHGHTDCSDRYRNIPSGEREDPRALGRSKPDGADAAAGNVTRYGITRVR